MLRDVALKCGWANQRACNARLTIGEIEASPTTGNGHVNPRFFTRQYEVGSRGDTDWII